MSKTSFSNCGPEGCQLGAVRPATGKPRARQWKKGFLPLQKDKIHRVK